MAFLSDNQFKTLKDYIRVTIDDVIVEKELVTKADIAHLPTKEEFYKETLKILKKLDDIKKSNTLLNSRVSKNSDKIEKLKKIHPKFAHV